MGRVMGLYYTSIGLGQFTGPLLSSVLTQYLNLRQMFLALSILPIVGMIFTLQLKSTEKIEKRFGGKEAPLKNRGLINSLRRIFSSKNVLGLCLSRVAFSFSAAIIATLLSVWAKTELQFTTSMISILFSARGATNTLIRIPIGRIIDKIGNKKPILFAFSLATITFLTFSVSTDFTLILVAMCIYGLAWGMRIVPDTAILATSVGSEDKGLALAILMSMFALGNSAGSYVAGATYNVLSMNLIFLMSAIILVFGIIILTVFIKEKKR
jgi:DHA1 family multidrug resistance protein-like MFS transporter